MKFLSLKELVQVLFTKTIYRAINNICTHGLMKLRKKIYLNEQ